MAKPNVVLTGLPRSGTTLACYLLNQLPEVVALNEPLRVRAILRLGSRAEMCDAVRRFFLKARKSLRASGRTVSRQVGGKVIANSFASEKNAAGSREMQDHRGDFVADKALSERFMLCIKDPALFTILLADLTPRFPCFALVRNPVSILASWNSVNFPMHEILAPSISTVAPKLATALAQAKDELDWQIQALLWYFESYVEQLPVHAILRYEDVIASRGRALRVVTPAAETLSESLENKNKNVLYDRKLMRVFGERLLQTESVIWRFYDKAEVEALLQ